MSRSRKSLDDLYARLDWVRWAKLQWFMNHKISFNQLHSQLPQTLAHALADSPVGLLGWNAQLMTADAPISPGRRCGRT